MSPVERVPVWLTAALSVLAVCLTLVADRVSMASTTAALAVRVSTLEVQSKDSHDEILKALESISAKVDENAVTLQQVIDRQEEVRRKLGIR